MAGDEGNQHIPHDGGAGKKKNQDHNKTPESIRWGSGSGAAPMTCRKLR